MEAIVGILIITVIIYTLNKVCVNLNSSRKRLPQVEVDEIDFEHDHEPIQESDRLDVAPEMVVNRRKSKKKKAGNKQLYSAAYLKQGIIMKEILDEPRAKKPLRKRRIYS